MGYRESVQRLSTFRAAAIAAAATLFLGTIVATQQPATPAPAPAVAAARALRNPVPSTPASIAAGKKAYDATCLGCHGNRAQGATRRCSGAGVEETTGATPP